MQLILAIDFHFTFCLINCVQREEEDRKKVELLENRSDYTPDFAYTDALRTTLLYIANAQRNIRVKKYRIIKKSSKVFSEKIHQSPACLKLLDIAGQIFLLSFDLAT